jgi:hypothetical protein
MRRLGSALLLLAAASPARADALAEAELRVGYGLAISGSGDALGRRASPLTVIALVAIALREDPPLAGFGGLVVETLDRSAIGATGGVRLALGRARFAGGGTAILAPATLWGATARGGACHAVASRVRACGDLELTAFFAGSDLAERRTITQVQAVLGVVFDAL